MRKEKHAVVFEPHNDDMVIGIGGTILQLLADDWNVKSIVLTDGRYGSTTLSPDETRRIRAREKSSEVERLGVDCAALNLEDSRLWSEYDENHEKVLEMLDSHLPDVEELVAFLPAPSEGHPDHRATYAFVQDLKKATPKELKGVQFLVWEVPFLQTEVDMSGTITKVDISEQLEEKQACIRLHESQVAEWAYSEMAATFNEYIANLYYKRSEADAAELLSVQESTPELYESLECVDVTDMFHEDAGR